MRKLAPILVALSAMAASLLPSEAGALTKTITENVGGNNVTVQVGVGTPFTQPQTCGSDACQGLDPYASGCTTLARPITEQVDTNADGVVLAIVELWFSGSCDAYWAEILTVQPPVTVAGLGGRQAFPVIRAYTNVGDPTPTYYAPGTPINLGNSWSPMVSASNHAQACLGDRPGQRGFGCTAVF